MQRLNHKEAKGDKFILFPTFSGNQLGLRKDKEPNSNYPAPSDEDLVEYFRKFSGLLPDDFLQSYGVNPDKIPLKLIKENLREVNTPPTPPNGEDGDFSEFDPVKVFSKVTGMAAIPAGDMPAVMTALGLWVSMTAIIGLFWVVMALVAGFIERRAK